MIGRAASIAGLCLLVAGCSTAADTLARDRQTCAAIGFPADSADFRNCVLQLQAARLGAPRVVNEYPPLPVPGPIVVAPAKPK